MTGDLFSLLSGDCRDRLAELDDDSVDAIVTDPPYELGFMGKRWDASGIAYDVEMWAECLRVVKPGGYLLAFGGTRTYHRMVCAIEDAGFEIRDSLHWIYGSGFPKSLDVSKAIDKQRHDRADVYRVTTWIREARDAAGISNRDIDNAFGANGMGRHWTDVPPHGKQPAVPTLEQVPTLLNVLGVVLDDVPDDILRLLWELNGRKGQPGENWAKREVVGATVLTKLEVAPGDGRERPQVVIDITSPATDAARQWEGWGTALKPAHEPIVVARKPLSGTVAANVMEHGTGALNIDGCRVASKGDEPPSGWSITGSKEGENRAMSGPNYERAPKPDNAAGRWPANIVITHAADCGESCAEGCPVAELDGQSGVSKDGVAVRRNLPPEGKPQNSPTSWSKPARQDTDMGYGGQGGASRFFAASEWSPEFDVPFIYMAKPSRAERNDGLGHLPGGHTDFGGNGRPGAGFNEVPHGTVPTPAPNYHPTVKPVALMRYLVRLVTRRHATVLDPFAGSGTTMVAAILEERFPIGIELTDEYHPIILGRCEHAAANLQMALF